MNQLRIATSTFLTTLGASALALTMALGACGGEQAGSGGGDDDWSGAKLAAPVDVDVKGQAIAVSLPEGLVREADSPFIRFAANVGDNFSLPSFTFNLVTIGAPKTVEDLKLDSGTKQKPMTVVKRVEAAGGLLISGHNSTKGTAELIFVKRRDDGAAVTCRAVQARSAGVPNLDATLAMFEKACTSMQLK